MKFDEVMKLLNAGYTREEILAMNEEPEKEPETQPEDSKDPATDDAADVSAITEALGQVKETFESFKKEMIAMNIMNSRIDGEEQSVDDIMASIINPFDNK